MHQVDGITTVTRVGGHYVLLSMRLDPAHEVFKHTEFGTDGCPIDMPLGPVIAILLHRAHHHTL